MQQHLVDTVVAGRYELTGVIGQGGQSIVYRGFDRHAKRGVAVKMLRDGRDPVIAARFAREQEALVALAGTSAVAVYDLCRGPGDALCLVMELLEGTDLEQRLESLEAQNERLPTKVLEHIFSPVVDTLERAHDAGIVHRDVKPANVFLLSNESGVRLLDFGFSRMRTAAKLTHAGTILGSPSYIAPEAWMGKTDELDFRVDVYSLGVVLFRALTGRLPFESQSLVGAFTQATTAKRPSLRALRPDMGPDADAWVERALAIDRDRRYGSVRELWSGLLAALQYTPPARPFRPVQQSLVAAWRAATSAFRRFIDAAGGSAADAPDTPDEPAPARKSPPPLPVSVAASDTWAIDEGWEELGDDDIEIGAPDAAMSAIDAGWEEVTEQDLVRPSLPPEPASAPPASAPVETVREVNAEPRTSARTHGEADADEGSAKNPVAETPAAEERGTPAEEPAAKVPAPRKAAVEKAAKVPAPRKAAVEKAVKAPAPKKAAVEKAAAKVSAPKKAAVEKAAAKVPAPKKAAVEKAAAKVPAAKGPAPKKAAVEKRGAKKRVPKKPAAKKAAVNKAASRVPSPKKSPAKKPGAKKSGSESRVAKVRSRKA